MLRRLAHPGAGRRPRTWRAAAQGRRRAGAVACCSRSSPGSATWSRSGCAEGDDADPEDVIARLVEIGYARVEMVTKRGELAVRGGLLDVFPPTEEHPLRIEFFGDTVEEIRVFKVADQRCAGQLRRTACGRRPAASCCSLPSVRARAKELAAKHPGRLRASSARSPTGSRSRAWRRSPPCSPTGWSCCSTTCRSAAWCSPATRSGSGPGRSSWSRPARSSSRRPG